MDWSTLAEKAVRRDPQALIWDTPPSPKRPDDEPPRKEHDFASSLIRRAGFSRHP